jgi:hypothetical protein
LDDSTAVIIDILAVSRQWKGELQDYRMEYCSQCGTLRQIQPSFDKLFDFGLDLVMEIFALDSPSSSELKRKVISALQRIDLHPIRCEYKVWIWKNYLAPSLYYCYMASTQVMPKSTCIDGHTPPNVHVYVAHA